MKYYTPEELRLDIRKLHEKSLPDSGEVVQAVANAYLQAIENFKASQLLFETSPAISFNSFVLGLEEIGKASMLAELLVIWSEPDKLKQISKDHTFHQAKLKRACTLLNKFITSSAGVIKKEIEGIEIDFDIRDQLNPETIESLHYTRLDLSYTGFNNNTAVSPQHAINKIDPLKYFMTTVLLQSMLERLWEIISKLITPFFNDLKDCFNETDPKKVIEKKHSLNRVVNRVMPAIRKYVDMQLHEHVGKSIDDLAKIDMEEFKNSHPHLFTPEMIGVHAQNIKEMIYSNTDIEEIYFYPPLKETAKSFYDTLSKTLQ